MALEGVPNLEEVLVATLKRVRKERKKRKTATSSPIIVCLSKKDTYVMMLKADLTDKQLTEIRKELFAHQVFILFYYFSINNIVRLRWPLLQLLESFAVII